MKGLFLRRRYPIGFTVTFDGNGGAAETATVRTGASGKLGYLPAAERSNYTFLGWFTAAEGGTQITTDTAFTEDTTVYAQWKANTYTITITGTGASGGTTYAQVEYNGAAYTAAKTLQVLPGEVLKCRVYTANGRRARVLLNGASVAGGTSTGWYMYNYYPAANAEIKIATTNSVGNITITEE